MYSVEITVTSGKGGDGIASFWHEKFQPFGGPDGGDGGKGADVYIVTDPNLDNLSAYRSQRVYRAAGGGNGGRQKMHGRDGVDLNISVPIGTLVYKLGDGTKDLLADLNKRGMRLLVARGGRGGLGNVHFATATNKAPKKATTGRQGESVRLLLEYNLMIEVCLLGLPNTGKSTLMSQITNAKPKIADYPFTTIKPVLGKVDTENDSFTIAEMPALYFAVHSDKNGAQDFLNHASRAKVLLFLVDGTSSSPAEDLGIIKEEVEKGAPGLLSKTQVIAVNKIDIEGVFKQEKEIRRNFSESGLPVFFISAKTGEGISALVQMLDELVKRTSPETVDEVIPEFVFRPKPIPKDKK